MAISRSKVLAAAVLGAALLVTNGPRLRGASKAVDLDGSATNGAESAVALDILTTFPPKVQNRVTNRSVGESFSFNYVSAGPGGFSSRLGTGTAAGVGAQWVWQTAQTILSFTGTSCANDICFTQVAGNPPTPTNSPANRVPGRTLVANAVTPSSASLTSSLLTFFSPPQLLAEVTSSVTPLANGQLAYETKYTNQTGSPISIEIGAAPLGCCPEENQLNCDGTCVDFLWDDENCGGCGNDCAEYCGDYGEPYCYYGWCECGKDSGLFRTGDSTPAGVVTPQRKGGAFGRDLGREVQRPRVLGKGPDPSPVCDNNGSTQVLEPGESITTCTAKAFLPKEASSVFSVCGNGIPEGETACSNTDPGSSGTFQQFVPDEELPYPYPGIFITPYQVTVVEPSGDGVLQPGETGMVYISVLNAGTDPLLDPVGTLSSPDIDLTDDEVDNPSSVVISPATSAFTPDLLPVPTPGPGSDCDSAPLSLTPSVNTVAFGVTIPADHPEDVARPFYLEFELPTLGFVAAFPISFGVGSVDADLSIGLTDAPDPAQAGSTIDYTVSYANAGPQPASNVVITVTLPTGLDLVTVSGGPSCSSTDASGTDVVTCDAVSLTSGASGSFVVQAQAATCTGNVTRTVTATIASDTPDEDTEDNAASETTQVQDEPPLVNITQPSADQTGSPPVTIPITIRFTSQAGASPIVHETVGLESCVIWDGLTYGDRDGLLSDETTLQTNKYILCQAMARCGMLILNYPKIRVTSENACGVTATDEVIIRKRLLKTEVCQ